MTSEKGASCSSVARRAAPAFSKKWRRVLTPVKTSTREAILWRCSLFSRTRATTKIDEASAKTNCSKWMTPNQSFSGTGPADGRILAAASTAPITKTAVWIERKPISGQRARKCSGGRRSSSPAAAPKNAAEMARLTAIASSGFAAKGGRKVTAKKSARDAMMTKKRSGRPRKTRVAVQISADPRSRNTFPAGSKMVGLSPSLARRRAIPLAIRRLAVDHQSKARASRSASHARTSRRLAAAVIKTPAAIRVGMSRLIGLALPAANESAAPDQPARATAAALSTA
jgi:hypothetical protein